MNFKLLITLITLPLASIFIVIAFKSPADGFWMNLGTELIGVLFTALVVDYLIERHQSAQWKGYKSRGEIRCRTLCNAIISSLRNAGGWSFDMIGWPLPEDEKVIHQKIIEFGLNHIKPNARTLTENLTIQSWKTLHSNFANTSQEIGFIIQRFGSQLTPAQFEGLDEISTKLSAVTTFPVTFPEMFERNNSERLDIRIAGINTTAKSITELIGSVVSFSSKIDAR